MLRVSLNKTFPSFFPETNTTINNNFDCMLNKYTCLFDFNVVFFLQIIKGSEDNPAQYMNFMNAIFTAQKQVSYDSESSVSLCSFSCNHTSNDIAISKDVFGASLK